MTRKTDYLFQRPRSKYWQLKLQSPDGRREISLHTTDHAQAEVIAFPMIAEHKAKLLAQHPAVAPVWVHELEPNRQHPGPDGGKIVATDRELIYIDAAGPSSSPRRMAARALPSRAARSQSEPRRATASDSARPGPRTAVAKNGDDDKIIETYLPHLKLSGAQEREVRATWALFHELCPSVKLKRHAR